METDMYNLFEQSKFDHFAMFTITHASSTVGQVCMNWNTSQIFFYNVNIIVMALYILN